MPVILLPYLLQLVPQFHHQKALQVLSQVVPLLVILLLSVLVVLQVAVTLNHPQVHLALVVQLLYRLLAQSQVQPAHLLVKARQSAHH